ncbi:MAG: hypothetical protein JSW46_02085 [Gemmatimonadota bacterium]|nr:MAG: hypothetical protein JSW46_02085 [Gemmatimonadota bacterium]
MIVVAALLLAAQLGGCAGWSEADSETRPQSQGEVTIEVENHNFYDARIYLLVLNNRTRLGTVGGNSTQTFSFPLQPADIRIVVDFIGAEGFVTEPMPVSAGEQLELQILPDAHRLRPKR